MTARLKWIWRHIADQKWLLLCILGLTILMMLAQFIGALMQQRIIDYVVTGGERQLYIDSLIIMAACYIVHSFLLFLTPVTSLNHYRGMRNKLSKWLLHYVVNLKVASLLKLRINEVLGLFQWHIHMVSFGLSDRVLYFGRELVIGLAYIAFLFWVHPAILFICLGSAAAYIYLGHLFKNKTIEASRKVWDAKHKMGVVMEERVAATREVIAFSRSDWGNQRYQKHFQRFYEEVLKETRLNNLRLLVSEPLKWGTVLVVLFYGGYLTIQNELSIGSYVVAFMFARQFLSTLQSLFEIGNDIFSHMAHVDRLKDFTGHPLQEEGTIPLIGGIQSIRLEQVRFRYEGTDKEVLQGVDIELPVGGSVAFVGESGGGKSTIASLLLRFYEPSEGQIVIDGVPLSDIKMDHWRNCISSVMQEPYLFNKSIRDNLCMGNESVTEEELVRSCKHARIDTFIDSLPQGFETIIGERGITLSGGQKQRIAIARALLRDSEVLILDEATSALDMETERNVLRSLQELRKDKTTIYIAHRLSTVRDCDMIIVLKNGAIIEKGTHDELMAAGSYYMHLYNGTQSSNNGLE